MRPSESIAWGLIVGFLACLALLYFTHQIKDDSCLTPTVWNAPEQ